MKTPRYTSEQLARLPKWAQARIQNLETLLESNVNYWKQKALSIQNDTSEVVYEVGPSIDHDTGGNLPTGSTVEFFLDSERRNSIAMRVVDDKKHGRVLHVMTGGRTNGRIVLTPVASNCFDIFAEDR